jgi:indole-3-glycerol phosphate synthase
MNILQEIAAEKRKEVAHRKEIYPVKLLETSPFFATQPVSIRHYLTRPDKTGLIAEFKRKSPSKGMINPYAKVEQTTIGYMQTAASGLSILTDEKYFGGKNADLIEARKINYCPILRKDFILDPYQVVEAKSIGADVVLLIAAMLTPTETAELAAFAKSLNLEVLLEVHDGSELDSHINQHVDIVGVNNRNLKNFEVSVDTSFALADRIPAQMLKISESGLSDPATVVALKEAGFNGFLIGESFMRSRHPEKACQQFMKEVQALLTKHA